MIKRGILLSLVFNFILFASDNIYYVTDQKTTFVPDVHGNIDQILLPILNKGAAFSTGKSLLFDLERGVRVNEPTTSSHTIVEIPDLILNESYNSDPIVFLGDYIDHRSVAESLTCFCLLADLLNQQAEIQREIPGYQAIVALIGNHELHPFYDPQATWNLGSDLEVKRQFVEALKFLVKEGRMQVSFARGCVLATHSFISKIFLEELLKEVSEEDILTKQAIEYFLDSRGKIHNYLLFDDKICQRRRVGVKKLELDEGDFEKYHTNLQHLSFHLNHLAKEILPKYGALGSGESLAELSVLFVDCGEGQSKFNRAIGPFWARPNMAGNLRLRCKNRVEPVISIQSAYGHHKILHQFGRPDIFIMDDKSLQSFQHILCFDGGATDLEGGCYVECDDTGRLFKKTSSDREAAFESSFFSLH